MSRPTDIVTKASEVTIAPGPTRLRGELSVPPGAKAIVLFAHGTGSSRLSPRNQAVARVFQKAGLGTLLFDLLTEEEEEMDFKNRQFRFDIELLATRLIDATHWLAQKDELKALSVGYFGSSTGGAAALVAAAKIGGKVGAVVSRGGRPDLAGEALRQVKSPTLLIVGERDEVVTGLNQQALLKLICLKELKIIARASHLFEEPGCLDEVTYVATDWFQRHLH